MNSDQESSIVSEDMSVASDGSELYDPRADQYDFRYSDNRGSKASHEQKRSPKAGNISFDASAGGDDGDDYSADFNDFENAESEEMSSGKAIHQERHENHQSKHSPKYAGGEGGRNRSRDRDHPHHGVTSPRDIPSPRRNQESTGDLTARGSMQMPSTGTSTLQAEVVLDEISKEVVRLRNQQRLVIQERRQVVSEKRSRAERRRKEYEDTLAANELKVKDAKRAQVAAENKAKELESHMKHLHDDKAVVRLAVQVLEDEVESMRGSVNELTESLKKAHHSRDEAERELKKEKKLWLEEKARLEVEIKKQKMIEGSVQQRIEANEARLEAERAKLPIHQERTLKEREKKLADMERDLVDRESALRVSEDAKLAAIEQQRKDLMSDMNRFRHRVESDLAAERQEVAKLRGNLISNTNQWELLKTQEQSSLESAKVDLVRREADLSERRQEYDREKANFDGQVKMVEPTVAAAHKDRDDARALKEQADRVMLAAEEHASSILKAERGLLKREQACSSAEAQLQEARNKLAVDKRLFAADTAKQRMIKQALDAERFRLHQLSLELTQQATQVKRGALIIAQADPENAAENGAHEASCSDSGELTKHGGLSSLSVIDPIGPDNETAKIGAVINYVERTMNSSTSIAGKRFNRRLSQVSPGMQGVATALENILLNTSEPSSTLEALHVGELGDGFKNYHADADTFIQSGTTLALARTDEAIAPLPSAAPMPVPPMETATTSALELLDTKLRRGAGSALFDGASSGGEASGEGAIDLSSLHKAVNNVSAAAGSMGSVASRYAVYTNLG